MSSIPSVVRRPGHRCAKPRHRQPDLLGCVNSFIVTPCSRWWVGLSDGRTFVGQRRVRLGDCSPGGRLRLDATARYLQDLSDDDTRDAGLAQMTWVVRRTVIDVHQFPTYLESLDMVTWCSGIGSRWAERRVDIASSISAATLWVHLDGETLRPATPPAVFDEIFSPSTGGRTVSSRLTLDPAPPDLDLAPVAHAFHRLRRDEPHQQRDRVHARRRSPGPPTRPPSAPASRSRIPIVDRSRCRSPDWWNQRARWTTSCRTTRRLARRRSSPLPDRLPNQPSAAFRAAVRPAVDAGDGWPRAPAPSACRQGRRPVRSARHSAPRESSVTKQPDVPSRRPLVNRP